MNKTAVLETQYPTPRDSVLEDLLEAPVRPAAERSEADLQLGQSAAVVGKLIGFSASGSPLVDFEGNPDPTPLLARYTCAISLLDIGREAVLVFERNDVHKPIVLGLLQNPSNKALSTKQISATLDGKQVTLSAQDEIVLRCGKASIALTRAGKVLINGEYVLSKSNGVNRIKGGSVQIN